MRNADQILRKIDELEQTMQKTPANQARHVTYIVRIGTPEWVLEDDC